MRCPHCGSMKDKVLESRTNRSGTSIRRRRQCTDCGFRFTSYEKVEDRTLMVIKRDGRREPFDEKKLQRSIRACTEKLVVSEEQIVNLAQDVEDALNLRASNTREIQSSAIGDETLRQLKNFNKVAYVRFAAVYRAYNDLGQFIQEIENLGKELN
ncbi:MAG: transcriptional regulator NrdR [Sphaerochaeta sp.]|jgi:transcriptional repressor NrdR|nr:transcriptional regulator NrdR [Sphaerochaeta sp.]MCH3920890.1 transcriptional regulator NrdR [Sphaerochaeta sp.]MCI2045215.1 transcriptional regulator NrdR [Sphaerochaeta sp.]MCI2096696.1 transcriptional regulator NrdR [Sphaerochaeta sp.]MCI2128374.1 transcriptional regulator NrdR [Sphaerochaeta sp.]